MASPDPQANQNSATGRSVHEVVSPVTGQVLERLPLASREEIVKVLDGLCGPPPALSTREVFDFLARLRHRLQIRRDVLVDQTLLETGFIAVESAEIVDGALDFLRDFEAYIHEQAPRVQLVKHSYSTSTERAMWITDRPVRCVAAVVPQNASLGLSLIIIASGLVAGARVVLRPSLQCGSTGTLLAEAVKESDPPDSYITTVSCLASDFIEACCSSDSVDLIHYIGSNQYAPSVLARAFASGKLCLLDGQGNGLLYVDEGFSILEVAAIITSGAVRFNGETCTSVNGVLVAEALYPDLKEALVESFRSLRIGSPRDPGVRVGPLFSPKQAASLTRALQAPPSGQILCGGEVDGCFFTPAVLDGVEIQDVVVREGFFGPAVWVRRIKESELWDWLRVNRFPLSDTVLTTRKALIHRFAQRSRAARICVNEDPSIESMFEPWGGYPPSGLNPVSLWTDKYRQSFQLDGRLAGLLDLPSSAQKEALCAR